MKNQREPKWKQLAHSQDKNRDKSRISHRSSKYNPKKSHSQSQRQFSLTHINNNSLNSDHIPYKGSVVQVKTSEMERSMVVERKKRQGSEIGIKNANRERGLQSGGGSSLDHAASSLYPKGPDSVQPAAKKIKEAFKTLKNPQEKTNVPDYFHIKIDPAISTQENFRQCLMNMEKAQRDLIMQRNEIQKMMFEEQQIYTKTKLRIFESFREKSEDFEDESLKKLIQKFIQKTRVQPRKMYRVTNDGNFTNQLQDRSSKDDSKIKKKNKSFKKLAERLSPKKASNPSFKQNFNKVHQAIANLRNGLDQCKKIRQQTTIDGRSKKFNLYQSSEYGSK